MSRVAVALTLVAFAGASAYASTNSDMLPPPDCMVTPTLVHPLLEYDPRLGGYAVVAVELDNAPAGCPASEIDVLVEGVSARGRLGDTIRLPEPVPAEDVTMIVVKAATEPRFTAHP